MTFGQKIVEARNVLGLQQKDLAELLGVTPTRLNYWEKDKREPDVEMIKMLAKELHVSADYLIGNPLKDGGFQITPSEQNQIEKYRDLDDHGKEMVDTVIQKETERMKRAKLEALTQIETEDLNHYWTPVSAGEGAVVDTLTDFDVIHVVSNIYTRKAAFVLTVRGESMAPRFHDGDLVLVQEADDTEIGEVGVWFMDGYSYIKQKGHDKLISLNAIRPLFLIE